MKRFNQGLTVSMAGQAWAMPRQPQQGLLRADRDFRWYWGGQSLSFVGTQVTAVAMPLIAALTLDAGTGGVSLVATAAFLPNLLFPLLAGHWLEGAGKRRAMIIADLGRALMLALVPIAHAAGSLSLGLLAAVAFVVGTGSVVSDVAGFAYLPAVVEEERLPEANRAMQGSATVAQVGGPGLGGLLVQALGAPLAAAADAASYLASAVGIAAARRPEPVAGAERSGRAADGIRILLRNPYLRALTVHASVYNAASQLLTVNLVIWAVQDRGVGAGLYGLALSAGGVGAFLGTMGALGLAGRLGYGRAFAASLVLSAGTPLLVAAQPFEGAALGLGLAALQLVAGVGLGSANVLSTTLRQLVIPHDQLARTTGGYRLLMYGSIPLGSALGGALGETLGSRAGVAIGACGLALSSLPMLAGKVRSLREPRDAAPAVALRA
jgi:MFS family permease